MSDHRRLLAGYYLYQATASCVFFSPIFFLYYQERAGLAPATILWVQSYFLLVRALLDLPLGAVADRYSRRACLVAYALGHMVGAATLPLAPTLPGVLAAETVFAAAGAFRSGADSAFLFDQLKAAGRLDLYPRAESRAQAVISLASGTTAIAGGLLAAIDLRLPYVATVLAAGASAAFAWSFGEAVTETRRRGLTIATLLGSAVRQAAGSPAVRWVMALAAFTVVSSHIYYYLQQPYLSTIGVPVALFGVVFAATKGVTALVSSAAHRIDLTFGPQKATVAMVATPVLGLGAMSLVAGPAGALLILSRGILDGLWQPLTNVYMNRLVDSHVRATMLSAQSLVARLALSGALALVAVGTARAGLPPTLAASALGAALVGAVLVLTAPRALAGERACDSREA